MPAMAERGYDFGAALRDERKRSALTQAQLAARAGMPQSVVSRLERGGREPRLSTMVRLAQALGITTAELVERALLPRESAQNDGSPGGRGSLG
jgi:transcriptional regulator with XRE-family HTH domain